LSDGQFAALFLVSLATLILVAYIGLRLSEVDKTIDKVQAVVGKVGGLF
jgi:uncharacterized protein YoxC